MTSAPFAQLQAFLAVAHHRSFSRAARELGVSRSAVSQAVQQLEDELRVVLLTRTTRSVALTEAGQHLVASASPAVGQLLSAFTSVGARQGETVGRVRLTVPRVALPLVIDPVVGEFRRRHPRIELEISVDDRMVNIVSEGYDAGVRFSDAIERDMVRVRLTGATRFVVVAAPSYIERHGAPERPRDLSRHECINYRSRTTGSLYAWELERGKRTWRVPVRGSIITNDGALAMSLVEQGLGLGYAFEPTVANQLRSGRLCLVLEAYAASVPGLFIYFPSMAQRSEALRLFIEVAKELAVRSKPSSGGAGSP